MAKRSINTHTGSTTALYQYLRNTGSAVACLILMGMLTACMEQGGASAAKKSHHDKVLRYDVNAPFTSLYPAAVKASGSTHIFPLLYSYLFVPDINGELSPDLSVKWTFEADKRQWTIHLRNDARFHNNKPVTANDVRFSLELFLKRRNPVPNTSIDRIIATTDKVLTIRLIRDDPLILYKLWNIEIVPHTDIEKSDNNMSPIGSGPFKFAHRQGDQMVTLEANPQYYGGPPALERIVFHYQPDREKAWTRLLGGATDIAQEIAPDNYSIVQHYKDRFHLNTYTLNYYTILLYNTHDPLFSNPKVRKALTMGIDRKYIVNHILNGFGRIATGPMGLASPFHDPGNTPLPFDPARALQLLNQAGWFPDESGRLKKNDKPFEFTIMLFKENQIEKEVARFIQLCLYNLGINTVVRALDYEEIKDSYYQTSQFQAVLTELNSIYHNPDFIKKHWSQGDHGKAYAGCFNHLKVNHLIEDSFTTKDPSKQKALLRELDLLIATLQPGTFLFQKTALDAMSRRFDLPFPFDLTNEGIYRLRHASFN